MANSTDLTQLVTQLTQLAQAIATQNETPEPAPARQIPPRVLLTAEEAAELLGIGRTLMFKLIREREIESVQIGNLRRIHVSAVEEYANKLVRRNRAA